MYRSMVSAEPIFVGALSGAIGGFLANFIANISWRKYTQPDLRIGPSSKKNLQFSGKDIQEIEFVVPIHNDGKTAARNCKAQLYLYGSTDTGHLIVNTGLCWSESGTPTTTTINPNDSTHLNLLKVANLTELPGVVFPSERGWEPTADIVMERENGQDKVGDLMITEGRNMMTSEDIETPERSGLNATKGVSIGILEDVQWEESWIKVSAENAPIVQNTVHLRFKERDISIGFD